MRCRGRKQGFGSALAVATVAVMTGCASSGSQPGAQAPPTQPAASQASATRASTPKEFVSKRYDFAVTLPQDWSEVDAEFDWTARRWGHPGHPSSPASSHATTDRTLVAAAAPVSTGMRLVEWRAAMVRGRRALLRLFVCGDDDARRRAGPGLDVEVRRGECRRESARRPARQARVRDLPALSHGERRCRGSAHLRGDPPVLPLHQMTGSCTRRSTHPRDLQWRSLSGMQRTFRFRSVVGQPPRGARELLLLGAELLGNGIAGIAG